MKEYVTKFDLEAAFKALDELDTPAAEKGIRANRPALTEIFSRKSKFDVLMEEYYDVSNSAELTDAKDTREAEIAQAKLARIEKIVDLDAESPDDILPSYVGKFIIQCPQCMTLFYKNQEDIEKSEEDETIVNVNEVCQHCGNETGYMLVGKVDDATPTTDSSSQDTGAASTDGDSDGALPDLDDVDVGAIEDDEGTTASEGEEDVEYTDDELDSELAALTLDDDVEDEEAANKTKKEESSFVAHDGVVLTEDVSELDISDAEFTALLNSSEFKKPISSAEVAAMLGEFEEGYGKTFNDTLTEGRDLNSVGFLRDCAKRKLSAEAYEVFNKSILAAPTDKNVNDWYVFLEDVLGLSDLAADDWGKALIDFLENYDKDTDPRWTGTTPIPISEFDKNFKRKNVKQALTLKSFIGKEATMYPREDAWGNEIEDDNTYIVKDIKDDYDKGYPTVVYVKGKPNEVKTVSFGYLDFGFDFDTKNIKYESLQEGIFDKLTRAGKAEWILKNARGNYNNAEFDKNSDLSGGKPVYNTFLVVGYKGTFADGTEITAAQDYDNDELVFGMNKVESTPKFKNAENLAQGWSMRQGNGPAFIFLAKDATDENAAFLCQYFKGELVKTGQKSGDKVDEYLHNIEQDLKGAKKQRKGGADQTVTEKLEASNQNEFCAIMENLEDLHEASFEELISNSLIESYKNVAGFRLNECCYHNEKLNINGTVYFLSGNTRNITYSFTEAVCSNDKISITGINEKLGADKQFTMTARTENRTLIMESFKQHKK